VPPANLSVITLEHNGRSNFIVWAYTEDGEDLLVNTIGSYNGSRLLWGDEPTILDIDADGNWTVAILPIGPASSPEFSGRGDAASGFFYPPDQRLTTWVISHDGRSNFVVWLYCAGGSDLIVNDIGAVTGSTAIRFEDGPCVWEVQADGNWSLTPRE
jgi:hypothetical protein